MNKCDTALFERWFRAVRLVGGVLVFEFLFLPGWARGAEEPRIFRYSEWQDAGANLVQVQNYRFEDRLLTLPVLSNWASFESENGDFIRLQHRSEPEVMIEIRFKLLSSMPPDEAAAMVLYSPEVKKSASSLVVVRATRDERYSANDFLFPRTFTLASQIGTPFKGLCTCFICPPYLYSVTLNAPLRRPTKGIMADYSILLRKFQARPRQKEVPAAGASSGQVEGVTLSTSQDAPAATNAAQ